MIQNDLKSFLESNCYFNPFSWETFSRNLLMTLSNKFFPSSEISMQTHTHVFHLVQLDFPLTVLFNLKLSFDLFTISIGNATFCKNKRQTERNKLPATKYDPLKHTQDNMKTLQLLFVYPKHDLRQD